MGKSGDVKKFLLLDFAFEPMKATDIKSAILRQNTTIPEHFYVHNLYSKAILNCAVIYCETDECYESFRKLDEVHVSTSTDTLNRLEATVIFFSSLFK